MDKVVSMKECIMHKLGPREDVLSLVISKAMSPKTAPGVVIWVWYEGCCDLLQHEEFSKYTAMSSVRNQTLPMPISTNLHSAKDSPSHTQISANAHKFFFFFFWVSILILNVYGDILTSFN